ncbi:MAG: hypothetical protein M0P12_07790 [Paludibacteraceae bacterium]|nr:hypothetical protein [Paludibacteraceae bacterium]MCK9155999.1 hypothetical protein [Paludibacteraceae bacterium]
MRHLYLTIIAILIPILLFAQSPISKNNTRSEYKDGRYFHTYSTCIVNAPYCKTETILNELFEGLKKTPTKSLRWAFNGLGKAKTNDENVQLYEKNVSYNPKTSAYIVTLLMIMDNNDETEFRIEGELKSVKYNTGRKEICLNVTEKVKVLNDGLISISAIPRADNTTVLILHSKLKFGFLVDMFFTQTRYKNIIEWRLAELLNNIKLRAENDK